MKEEIKDSVMEKIKMVSGKKSISCKDALEIAEHYGVSPSEIGAVCEEEDIKVRGCQLGCF